RTDAERWIAKHWRDILHIAQVGVFDNFFELGGDSIRGAQFLNRVQEALGEVIYISALFDAPTIATFVEYLKRDYANAEERLLGRGTTDAARAPAAAHESVTAEHVETFRHLIPAPTKPLEPRAERVRGKFAFILSPPRSGSTLLRVLLAGNPALFAPPEL